MIGEFFYVLKIGMFTFLLVMFMQIEVGEKTLESHSYKIILEASKTLRLNQVAHGMIQAIKEGHKLALDSIENWTHKSNKSSEHLNKQ